MVPQRLYPRGAGAVLASHYDRDLARGHQVRAVATRRGRSMHYRPLGNSGLLVSVVGLGCNNFGRRLDAEGTRAVVGAALDAGITLLDTADIYGGDGQSEELLGEVLAGRRGKVVLATKFGHRAVDMGYGPAAGAKGSRNY